MILRKLPGGWVVIVRNDSYFERDLLSLNDHCPVTESRLNPAIGPVYVNSRPIGFC